ncbi:DEAD/DEAH box helicase [Soonwooa sp.]|uniref:DEAD/DEAH box helicase n=1 Tax=Soonwooa sp. TaxID=1938592 RepID=UPI00260EF40F|nr:DEAD/DEAH box helicase [Soonwooa sp.]
MQIDSILSKLQIPSLNTMQNSAYKTSDNFQDLVLLSPTGSGKTLAFLFPVLRNLKKDKKGVQALIMAPSRELAIQIEQVFKSMGTGFKVNSCYGGHSVKIEENNFKEPPVVLVGTPGRIAYHIRNQNFNPKSVETLVLDEFDKSLEFGFTEDMSFIIGQMKHLKHRILTSATEMREIPEFTGLKDEKYVDFLREKQVKPNLTLKKVMSLPEEKLETLIALIGKIGAKNTLIFCNHREAVNRISELLEQNNVTHESFHGGMEQDERERALLKFRNGSIRILITTDLAARGLDIPEVEAIIHYQLPPKEDAFIHRNGRTARMKASGIAYLIMTKDEQYPFLKNDIKEESLSTNYKLPKTADFKTLYISAGKKDKVNKVDIVGYLIKTGGLEKDDVGLIEVKDTTAYVAVNATKVRTLLANLKDKKLKGKKVKIEIAM